LLTNICISSKTPKTWVVWQKVEDSWEKYMRGTASYMRFSNIRGQWDLRRHHQLASGQVCFIYPCHFTSFAPFHVYLLRLGCVF
jgi:hypothetical protein